jgi:GT2 family glycosyltransferase
VARVAIIILNWNGRRFLEDCLTAVLAQTYPDYEVLLVDNGSDDGSAEWVAERFPSVCLIRNPTNLGFAVGNNQAIRASSSEFIATLNNDTYVEPGWLAELVQVMESEPAVGSCASKILFADRPHVIDSTGICMDPVGIPWDRRGSIRSVASTRISLPTWRTSIWPGARAWRGGAACTCPLPVCTMLTPAPLVRGRLSRTVYWAATSCG